MKLLTASLTQEQAQIVFYFQLMERVVPFVKSDKIDITGGDDQEFGLDWLVFYKFEQKNGGALWSAGMIESFGGSYWTPPDIDFVEIYEQKPRESLVDFVENIIVKIIKDRFGNVLSADGESVFDYQCRQMRSNGFDPFEDLPF